MATLNVVPMTNVPPGASLQVSGSGFPGQDFVVLVWANSIRSPKVRTSKTGTFDTTFTVPNVSDGTYVLQVRAERGDFVLASVNISVLKTAPPIATVPGVPLNLSATSGNATVTLTWAAPTSNGGSTITGYRVYRDGVFLTSLGNVLTYTNTGLVNGVQYTYKVSAVNVIGEGAQSTGVVAFPTYTPPPPPDAAPVISNIVTTITQTSVGVAWHVSEPAQGWIEYGATNTYGKETLHETSYNYSDHVQTITGLTENTLYHFRIHAIDIAGQHVTSADQTVTTSATTPPVEPPPPTTGGVYGPAMAIDGKDNRWIGGTSPGREVAHRWRSTGGTMTSYAFNQRFGADGSGYSMGDGGLIQLNLYACDANGLPTGSSLSTVTLDPVNPNTQAETRTAISWSATVPVGLVCVTHKNIHASPTANWMSANETWVPSNLVDSPRQPAFPDDSMAVLSKNEFSSSWTVVSQNTPVFDVTFADSHHEGQGYYERFVSPNEVIMSDTLKTRERFTPTQAINVKAVWMRVQRKSGPGPLTVQLAGQTATASIGQIPIETLGEVYTGGKWVRVPLVVSLPANVEQSAVFSVAADTQVRVVPIRQAAEFGSRMFTQGVGEKFVNGAWAAMYFDNVADIQMYLETENTTVPPPPTTTRPWAAPVTTATFTVPTTIDRTGATDTYLALNNWLATVPNGSIVSFPANGTYKLSQGLKLGNRSNLIFKGNGSTLQLTGAGDDYQASGFVLGYGYSQGYWVGGSAHITIDGFTIVGNDPTPGTFGGGENQQAIDVHSGSSFVEITNVTTRATFGDGVFVIGSNDVWIHHNTVQTAGRNGVTQISGNRTLIEDNTFTTVGYATLDIEPNFAYESSSDVIFRRNTAGTWQSGIGFVSIDGAARGADIQRITIANNTITGMPIQMYIDNKGGTNGTVGARMKNITVTDNTGPSTGTIRITYTDGVIALRNSATYQLVSCTMVTSD